MKNTIEKMMNELRTDHRNMVLLLDLLDAETVRLADSDEPDYELIYDVMTYLAEYPDAVHHPKEDLIYRHIKSKRPDIDESLQRHILLIRGEDLAGGGCAMGDHIGVGHVGGQGDA